MHPALLKLMRLRGWAFCRRIVRSMKTVRGAVMTLFMLVMFGLMVGPSLYFRLTMNGDNPQLDQGLSDHLQSLEDAAPIGLMLLSIISAFTAMGEKAISFSPAEVNFLFPAPFTRRELLLYRITASSFGGLLFAAIMSVSFLTSVRSWPAAFMGLFLALQLVNLLSIISALIAQVISQQAYTLGRRIVWGAVGLLLAIGLTDVLSSANLQDPWEAANKFRNTWAGVCLTAPFAVYTDIILADGLNALFLGRLFLAGGINLLLVVLAIRLDANYLEVAGHISERLYERMRQMQWGGGFSVASKPGKSYRRFLPSLPRWRGVGSILQVQLTLGFRTSGRLVAVGAIIAVLIVASSTLFSEDNDITEQLVTSSLVIGITAYLTMLGAMTLPLGLRGDVDHMDWLKSMPVTPLVVALGEVLGPALFMSFIHGLIFVPASTVVRPTSILLIATAFSLPFNLVLFGIENLVFALYPNRLMQTTPGDFQQVGVQFTHILMKSLLFGMAAAPVALLGTIAWLAIGPWLAMPVMWLTAVGVGGGFVILVARAFDRFDPSLDSPP